VETGYRSWHIGFNEKGEPRLLPLNRGGAWEPGEEGEVVSDWEGEEKEKIAFKESSKGLYSLKSLKEARGYNKQGVHGAIIPYGVTSHGERGFRSEKAKVKALYKGQQPCWVCGQPAQWILRVSGEAHFLCNKDRERIKRLIEKEKAEVFSLDDLLSRLASIYDAEVVEWPSEEV
jgi:hypothetical protein